MFPLSDDNPRHRVPVVTLTIIGICISVFIWQVSVTGQTGDAAVLSLGMIPARLFGDFGLPAGVIAIPAWLTIFTSLFLHGGWLHLGGNMLFLWIFGDNVEDAMGRPRFIVFYLACGVAAALAQAAANPSATAPMIGASGAIAGVLGGYILLYPHANVRTLVFLGFFVTVLRIPAAIVLGIWFLLQFLNALGPGTTEAEGVAVWAHVGGFVAGLALVAFFKRSEIQLLQPPRSRPFTREAS
ncbi:MAG: rhomboid family intramembrane serine protease [Pseudolabrys sp.]|nr:rhomboid family intramembrane serine protease [Pseudolabrys sp.]